MPPRNSLPQDPGELTLGDIFHRMRVRQMWAIAGAVAALLAGSFALGHYVAGIQTGSRPPEKVSPPVQRWLTIHSVSGETGARLKLVARVNSIPYSYPADVMMTVVDANMPEQKCPLPFADNYEISFEAYFRQADSEPLRNAKNRETASFAISQLPAERQRYMLHEVIAGNKEFYEKLTVTYSIR